MARWQCPRGHFVAHEDIHSEDHIDPTAYYGVSPSWEYTCRGCEATNSGQYMYFTAPKLIPSRPAAALGVPVEEGT